MRFLQFILLKSVHANPFHRHQPAKHEGRYESASGGGEERESKLGAGPAGGQQRLERAATVRKAPAGWVSTLRAARQATVGHELVKRWTQANQYRGKLISLTYRAHQDQHQR